MVTLSNSGPRAITIMLAHDTADVRYMQSVRDKASGAVSQKRKTMQVQRSVTIAPKGVLTGLPDEVLKYPDVLVGMTKGLKALVVSPEPVTPAAEPAHKSKPSRKGK